MIKDDYLISITGKHIIDGKHDNIAITVRGSYKIKGKKKYIIYKEYNKNQLNKDVTSILKVEDEKQVTLIRNGYENSHLILENGKRHMCHYDTGLGKMMVGVFAKSIDNKLNANGGKLKIKYSLDYNYGFDSINEINVNVAKIKEKEF